MILIQILRKKRRKKKKMKKMMKKIQRRNIRSIKGNQSLNGITRFIQMSNIYGQVGIMSIYAKGLMMHVHPSYQQPGVEIPLFIPSLAECKKILYTNSQSVLDQLGQVFNQQGFEPWEKRDINMIDVAYDKDVISEQWQSETSIYLGLQRLGFIGQDLGGSLDEMRVEMLYSKIANIILNVPTGLIEGFKRANQEYASLVNNRKMLMRVVIIMLVAVLNIILSLLILIITVIAFKHVNKTRQQGLQRLLAVPKTTISQIVLELTNDDGISKIMNQQQTGQVQGQSMSMETQQQSKIDMDNKTSNIKQKEYTGGKLIEIDDEN
ncbi:MAG: hypothetical protein EZS28_047998, partial [Streblomastix strix]